MNTTSIPPGILGWPDSSHTAKDQERMGQQVRRSGEDVPASQEVRRGQDRNHLTSSGSESGQCSKVLSGPVGSTLVRSGWERESCFLLLRSSSSLLLLSASSAWILSSTVPGAWRARAVGADTLGTDLWTVGFRRVTSSLDWSGTVNAVTLQQEHDHD